ncbi:AraC family transcriptional regulator [Alkalihalobacillus trypoxylicola]|uniref:HTH araC/xylS-type domain-containing protein n=1 Tax=Alkalihalobacillus trypoxylicola TaxID=519424 RepID=A0A162DPK6_9BACI|nr:AraC family transcriptional regulator [Alkalihalobacillus trypoxylicola]KYG30485.1 hypothetical protein AZF04_19570 [Alkalihalobacillus trypoxylicola]
MVKNRPFEIIGFRSKDHYAEPLVHIFSIGMEQQVDSSYSWNGLERKEKDIFIFQYTISGEGKIRVGNNVYSQKKEHGFFVHVPSDHCYFIPEDSNHWEFIFITLTGQVVEQTFQTIYQKMGHASYIPYDNPLIQRLFSIYDQALTHSLDAYQLSGEAYLFLMECLRYIHRFNQDISLPPAINQAKEYIEKNYHMPLSVGDIAEEVGLSKYYLIKQFGESMNGTPIQYLNKVRIKKSIQLLKYSELSIKKIAVKVGFTNDNYFNKVFRKVVGVSPGEFRQHKHTISIDRLIIH